MNIKQTQKGFTLIELMIIVAIVGILAAIALPAYSDYTKKAKFTQVIAAVGAAKTAIEVEYSGGKALTDLDGTETCTTTGTPPVTACVVGGFLSNFVVGQNSGRVELLEIADGVITAVGGGEFDTGAVTDVSYILTPSISNGSLNWATTGSCTTAGLC